MLNADKKRFWTKVQKGEDCWKWTAHKDRDGYGQFHFQGKTWQAHRVAVVFEGRDPAGKIVMHRCDEPSCVNPNHLEIGTHPANMRDMTCKGRQSSVLTAEDVLEIRQRYSEEEITYQQLADEFGVSKSTIGRAVRRETWQHLTRIPELI